MGTGGMGHMGNGNTWAVGYRVWHTVGISFVGHMEPGGMGYRGMGNRGVWGNRVQGLGYRTHGQ